MSANIKSRWWRTDAAPSDSWWRPAPAVNVNGELPEAGVSAVGKTDDSALPFWALFAFTFILLVSPQSYLPVLGPLRIALIAVGISLMAYVYNRLATQRPILELTRETRIALLLFGWAVITVPFSYWPGGSVAVITGHFMKSIVVFVLLSQIVNTLPRLKLIAWGLALMTIPLAVTAVKNYVTGKYLTGSGSVTRIVGYDAPLTGNPNDLALTLNLMLPMIIALLAINRKLGQRTLLMGLILLSVAAIIATNSRTGFLTLAVVFGTYLVMLCKRRGIGWGVLALVLMLGAVPFLPSGYVDRLTTITNIDADATGSAQERWAYMTTGVKYTLTHPLAGAGVGMNVLALNQMSRSAGWKEVHNVYLQYAMELGIPGLVLFLMVFRGCLKSVRAVRDRFAERPDQPDLFHLAQGIRVSLIAFAVAAMFHPVAYHFYFYYFAGLALATKAIGDGIGPGMAQPALSNTDNRRGTSWTTPSTPG